MRTLLSGLVVFGLLAIPAFGAEPSDRIAKPEKEPVRSIDTKDLKLEQNKGRLGDPTVIKSEEELAKAVTDKDTVDKIKKQVDFKTEKLVFFAWSGSGGDKLSFKTGGDKKVEVMLTYTPGLTRDLRPHFYLIVMPKDAECKMEK